MNAPIRHDRITRRVPFLLRRDAVQQLSNGRHLYDAFFSRVGLQGYGDSIEYRPAEEVFKAASLASGALCPGVLLHPDTNFGTNFGEGSYPVRGATGERITQHTDGIHTAGKLMVWDRQWLDLIESQECSELSVGYSIEPDYTPGTVSLSTPGADIFGRDYHLVHRNIVWDHVAGVPQGNAGSAMVVRDAATDALLLHDRQALRAIADMRADARPRVFDVGGWRSRVTDSQPKVTKMDETKIKALLLQLAKNPTPKAVHDAMVEISGDTTDPQILAALQAMQAIPGVAPEAGAEMLDEDPAMDPAMDPTLDPTMDPAADPAAVEPDPAADPNAPAADPAAEPVPPVEDPNAPKMDARRKQIHDMADARARVLLSVYDAFGRDHVREHSATIAAKSNAGLMRMVLDKLDAGRLAKVDAKPKAMQAAALEFHFDEACEQFARRHDYAQQLLDAVRNLRNDNKDPDAIDGPLARLEARSAAK